MLPSILIIPLRAALAAAALMLLVQRQPPGRRLTLPCTSTVCRISRAPLTGESPTAPEAELTTIRAHNGNSSNNNNDAGNHGSTDSIVEEEDDDEGAASLSREEMDNGLPLDAPVVVVLHGIGGTAHDP